MAKPKGKLFLFHWEKEGAMARAAELKADGWRVEMEFEEGSRGCKNLKAFGPDVVVFDIAQKGVHSRECGRALRNAKSFRETPFILWMEPMKTFPRPRRKFRRLFLPPAAY